MYFLDLFILKNKKSFFKMVTKQILKQYFINFFLKKKKGVHFQEFNFFFLF